MPGRAEVQVLDEKRRSPVGGDHASWQTGPDNAERPDRYLRIRRLEVRVPPSAPRSTATSDLARSSRLACLDQEAAGVGDERPAGLDPLVQGLQLAVVLLDGEVRDKPDHLAQEIDHRADIEELHP